MVENPLINHPQFQFQHSFENHLSSKMPKCKKFTVKEERRNIEKKRKAKNKMLSV